MWSILYWNEGMGFQGRLALALAGAVNRLGQQRLCYNGEPCKEGAAMGVSRGGARSERGNKTKGGSASKDAAGDGATVARQGLSRIRSADEHLGGQCSCSCWCCGFMLVIVLVVCWIYRHVGGVIPRGPHWLGLV